MGRGFVGQKGQLAHVRGEQVVGRGKPAHLGCVHETRVGNELGAGGAEFVNGHEDPVVPVHVGLQVVEDQGGGAWLVNVFGQMGVEFSAPVALSFVAHQKGLGHGVAEGDGGLYGGSDEGRGAPVDGEGVAVHNDLVAFAFCRAADNGKFGIGDGSDYDKHWRESSS